MATWRNDDGLELRFGTDRAKINPLGEYRFDGPKRLVEIKFDYTQLPTVAQNSVVVDENLLLPIGAVVEAVEIFTYTDFTSSGSSMTLNVGTIDSDHASNIDVDSLVVAATQAELITGGTNVAGWVGVAVGGVPFTTPKLITWEVDSQAATAGEAAIRIYYSVP